VASYLWAYVFPSSIGATIPAFVLTFVLYGLDSTVSPMSHQRSLPMRELSHPITPGMQVYSGDPAVDIEPALVLAHDGVDVALLHLGSHTGTHLDAPSHCIAGGRTAGAIGLDELVADALVVHLDR
jgi:Putative cyclase